MQRIAFLRMAARRGWSAVRHPVENISLLVALLAAFGLPTTIGVLKDAGLWGLAIGAAAGLAALVLEGAFRIWREADREDREASEVRALCREWRERVENFMEVRDAKRPLIPEGPSAKSQLARKVARLDPLPVPDTSEARAAAEVFDRETVSEYLATYAKPGLELFEELVRRGALAGLDRDRDAVRSPRSCSQIRDAVFTMHMAEFDDLRLKSGG
jgi:hypothetical protein